MDHLGKFRDSKSVPVMVEYGAYWAYYSLWFLSSFPEGKAVCVEPDPKNIEVGRRNFALNGREGIFIQGGIAVGKKKSFAFITERPIERIKVRDIPLSSLLVEQELSHVDVLLADIQGAEIPLLKKSAAIFKERKVRFVFISTHDFSISGSATTHQQALAILTEAGAKIVVEHSVSESYSGDGLIVASFDERDKDLSISISYARSKDSLFGEWEPRLETLRNTNLVVRMVKETHVWSFLRAGKHAAERGLQN